MLFPDFTAIDNLCFPSSRKARDFWINPVYRASCLREYSQYFEPGALKRYPDELSAQDLLKLVYCRWHLFKPSVVVCVKPFSSIDRNLEDIGAFFIDLLLKKGIAVLILTSSAAEIDVGRKKIVINQKNDPLHPKNDL
jgi:ribose transport system ATP-binding protein